VGHYPVRTGHLVYINDSSLFSHLDVAQDATKRPDVLLRFYADDVDPMLQIQTGMHVDTSNDMQALLVGYTAHFGGEITTSHSDANSLRFARQDGIAVHRDLDNARGCESYRHSYPDSVLVVHRGDCTFLEKLLHAKAASAAGVLVISDDNLVINPTANLDEVEAAGDLSDVALVLLPQKAGEVLTDMLDHAEQGLLSQVRMVLEDDSEESNAGHIPPEKDPNRILYINGHPLLNTRLLV
jgi:mannosidase alpha-like ER degradation enhancer 1